MNKNQFRKQQILFFSEEKRNLLKKLGKMKNIRIEKVRVNWHFFSFDKNFFQTDKKRSNDKPARSSTKFFEQLQQSTLTTPTKKHRRSDKTTTTDSKRLKL